MGYEHNGPGVFCIKLEDFLHLFSETQICKYEDDDFHSYEIKNGPAPRMNFFEFTLGRDFKFERGLDILANQMGDRLKRRRRADGS